MATCQNVLPTEIIGFARQKETIDLPSKFPWSPESARQMQANFSTGRVERSRGRETGKDINVSASLACIKLSGIFRVHARNTSTPAFPSIHADPIVTGSVHTTGEMDRD